MDSSLQSWEENRSYGVIIDCGSSGSRIYVYSWKDHEHLKAVSSLEELQGKVPTVERGDQHGLKWTRREEPGISTYGSKPAEVGGHLSSLLEFATEVVPKEAHSTTPIFLMATAGMRLLPFVEQQAVLDSACRYITKNTPFFMSDCDTHIQVISGELEGVYGWVGVNYLMGGFDTSIQAYIKTTEREQHHTFGFLDMGGASAQIAFEPEHHQKQEHMHDLTTISLRTLDGTLVKYDVFVTTFLGYGSNEARRRYLEERVKEAHIASEGKNLLDEHHTLHLNDPCLSRNLNITDSHSTSISLSLHGTGVFEECMKYTMPLLNKTIHCPQEPCLFNGVHTPHIDWSVNKFVGISEYWYSSHDILGLGGMYDFSEYEKKATDYCAKNWDEFLKENQAMDPVELHRYQLQCFKSAWIVNVLHDGIEIPRIVDPGGHGPQHDKELLEQSIESVEAKNWNPPFQSIDTINDIQVSWTLGAMLLHVANQIPLSDTPDRYQGHDTDDESEHTLPDTLQSSRPPPMKNLGPTLGVNQGSGRSLKSLMNNPSFTSLVMVVLMVLCIGFIIYLFKNARRKRRFDTEYHRVEAGVNGGLLGPIAAGPGRPSTSSITQVLSSRLSQSMLTVRYWGSRLLRTRNYSTSLPMVEIDTLPDTAAPGESVSIYMQPAHSHATLGISTKSPSAVSMKYWSKKRYSGDSHNLNHMIHGQTVEGSSILPFRTPSVLGLANRNGSSPNLTRNSSSPNLNHFSPEANVSRQPLISSPGEPLLNTSRSRVGFVIQEISDEEEYMSDSVPETTASPVPAPIPPASTAWLSSGASPRASPRGSLDERRVAWTARREEGMD